MLKRDMIYDKALQFRMAIEKAVDHDQLSYYPFNKFPSECCDYASELLAQYLFEAGVYTVMIRGTHINDLQRYHIWLRTLCDGLTIDITADQFSFKGEMPSNIPSVIVGSEKDIHGLFGYDRKEEKPMLFYTAENRINNEYESSKRVYELICAYEKILEYL